MFTPPSTRAVAELVDFVKHLRTGAAVATVGIFFQDTATAALVAALIYAVLSLLVFRVIAHQDRAQREQEAAAHKRRLVETRRRVVVARRIERNFDRRYRRN